MLDKKAFSLIELLVVLVLLNLFLLSFIQLGERVWGKALSLSCRSNMRQLGMAFYLYRIDNLGRLPHTDRDSDEGQNNCWFDRLDLFLGESRLNTIKQCPAWEGYSSLGDTIDRHSIKMNGGLCPKDRLPETLDDLKKGNFYWPRLQRISQLSRTVLLLDGRTDEPFDRYTGTRKKSPYKDVSNRHNEGANLLFIDGSCVAVNAWDLGLSSEDNGWEYSGGYVWEPYGK